MIRLNVKPLSFLLRVALVGVLAGFSILVVAQTTSDPVPATEEDRRIAKERHDAQLEKERINSFDYRKKFELEAYQKGVLGCCPLRTQCGLPSDDPFWWNNKRDTQALRTLQHGKSYCENFFSGHAYTEKVYATCNNGELDWVVGKDDPRNKSCNPQSSSSSSASSAASSSRSVASSSIKSRSASSATKDPQWVEIEGDIYPDDVDDQVNYPDTARKGEVQNEDIGVWRTNPANKDLGAYPDGCCPPPGSTGVQCKLKYKPRTKICGSNKSLNTCVSGLGWVSGGACESGDEEAEVSSRRKNDDDLLGSIPSGSNDSAYGAQLLLDDSDLEVATRRVTIRSSGNRVGGLEGGNCDALLSCPIAPSLGICETGQQYKACGQRALASSSGCPSSVISQLNQMISEGERLMNENCAVTSRPTPRSNLGPSQTVTPKSNPQPYKNDGCKQGTGGSGINC